jgi:hypothetical protein
MDAAAPDQQQFVSVRSASQQALKRQDASKLEYKQTIPC